MEKFVLFSAFLLVLIELCNAGGAYAQQGNTIRKQPEDLRSIQEFGQVNEAPYAKNIETIMQLLAERDATEAEWRRQEALDRENLMAELSAQKRGSFNYYGGRGKRVLDQQKRFQYFPSRGK